MAGDWIKMRPSLLTSPKVNGMARFLENSTEVGRALSTGFNGRMSEIVNRNVMRNVTVAGLLTVWGAANEHTVDGVFTNADLSDIDDMVGVPGFGEAMALVGWAVEDEDAGTVTLPNFTEYNTCGKDRAAEKNAERQRRFREKKKVVGNVTDNVTCNDREEKRREEVKEPPLTPPAGGEPTGGEDPKPEDPEPPATRKRERKPAIAFQTFLEQCKERGEPAIAGYTPMVEYVEQAKLPTEFAQLCWDEFKRRHLPGGGRETKRQADWRRTFLNALQGGWFKLWWSPEPGRYELTSAGLQAKTVLDARRSATERAAA